MRIPCSLLSHSVMSNSLQPKDCSSQASLSFTISWDLIKPMSIDLVMPSNLLILCHWLFFLPSTFPSIRVFSSEFALHIRCSKYWNFSFRISPPPTMSIQWILISFGIDWLDLLAVQWTLKSLLQHHSSKATFLLCSFSLWPTLTFIHDNRKNHRFD